MASGFYKSRGPGGGESSAFDRSYSPISDKSSDTQRRSNERIKRGKKRIRDKVREAKQAKIQQNRRKFQKLYGSGDAGDSSEYKSVNASEIDVSSDDEYDADDSDTTLQTQHNDDDDDESKSKQIDLEKEKEQEIEKKKQNEDDVNKGDEEITEINLIPSVDEIQTITSPIPMVSTISNTTRDLVRLIDDKETEKEKQKNDQGQGQKDKSIQKQPVASAQPRQSSSSSSTSSSGLSRPDTRRGTSLAEPVPVPLFDEKWPEPSPEDEWCFLCCRGDFREKLLINVYYKTLDRLIGYYGTMSTLKLCEIIQRYYRETFRSNQINTPDWSLRSIRKHVEHDGVSNEAMLKNVTRVVHKQITTLTDTGLTLYDPTSKKVFCNSRGTGHLTKLTKTLISCIRSSR